jgi:uncharacterized protein YndB with AHSA1/START domain
MSKASHDAIAAREIISRRVINAPREVIFEAWSHPDHVAQWWGPKGFSCTFQEFDMRAGGYWRFVMHGPDGVNYKNTIVFVEVVRPERIVFNHISGPKFQVRATLEEQNGKTQITFRMLFPTIKECEKAKLYAVEANEQNFDRLEQYLPNVKIASTAKLGGS